MNEQATAANPNTAQRVTVYDWLRLIATIFVVIGHSSYTAMQTPTGGVDYMLMPADVNPAYMSGVLMFFRSLYPWVYGFHMPLFFILSGAVLALKPVGGFDSFVKSKIKRLIIPYFVYGILFMIPMKYLGNFYAGRSVIPAIGGVFTAEDGGHLWFLTALFWCMIAFVILKKIVERFGVSPFLLLILAGLIHMGASYLPFDVFGLKKGLGYIFWFALGYVFEHERQKHGLWNIKKTVLAYIVLTVVEVVDWKKRVLPDFFVILCGSFHTFLLADILNRAFVKVVNTKGWKVLMRNLFYIYIFHDPLEYVVMRLFIDNGCLKSAVGCYMYTFTRFVVVFAVSMLLGELILFLKRHITRFISDKAVGITN